MCVSPYDDLHGADLGRVTAACSNLEATKFRVFFIYSIFLKVCRLEAFEHEQAPSTFIRMTGNGYRKIYYIPIYI